MTAFTDRIGGPPVIVQYLSPRGMWTEVACDLIWGEVTIITGRAHDGDDVEPSSATLTLYDADGVLTRTLEIRTRLRVCVSPNLLAYIGRSPGVPDTGGTMRRFDGWISEAPSLEPQPGGGALLTLIASGIVAEVNRTYVGDVPWPTQDWQDRVLRITNAAGFEQPLFNSNSGVPQPWVIARDVDRRSAGELLDGTLRDGRAALFETWTDYDAPTGPRLRVVSDDYRAMQVAKTLDPNDPTVVKFFLDACDVLVSSQWSISLAAVVNELAITYGDTPVDGGERPTYLAIDADSQARFGRIPTSVSLEIISADGGQDVTRWADETLRKNSRPRWALTSLRVDVGALLSKEQMHRWLLRVCGSEMLQLTGLDPALPVNYAGLMWLEGWVETFSPAGWYLDIFVSDAVGASGIPWNAVDPATRWADVPPALTWRNADLWDGKPATALTEA